MVDDTPASSLRPLAHFCPFTPPSFLPNNVRVMYLLGQGSCQIISISKGRYTFYDNNIRNASPQAAQELGRLNELVRQDAEMSPLSASAIQDPVVLQALVFDGELPQAYNFHIRVHDLMHHVREVYLELEGLNNGSPVSYIFKYLLFCSVLIQCTM